MKRSLSNLALSIANCSRTRTSFEWRTDNLQQEPGFGGFSNPCLWLELADSSTRLTVLHMVMCWILVMLKDSHNNLWGILVFNSNRSTPGHDSTHAKFGLQIKNPWLRLFLSNLPKATKESTAQRHQFSWFWNLVTPSSVPIQDKILLYIVLFSGIIGFHKSVDWFITK